MIRVVVVDDHSLVRAGPDQSLVEAAEDIDVVGEAADGQQALGIVSVGPALMSF